MFCFYLLFCRVVQDQVVMYPSTETMISYAIEKNNYEVSNNPEERKLDVTHCQRLLSDVDSLYEVHDQVCIIVKSLMREIYLIHFIG